MISLEGFPPQTTRKGFTHPRSTSWESAISFQKIPRIILGTDGIFRKLRHQRQNCLARYFHAINVKSDGQYNIFVKNSTLISITYVCSTWGGIAATESLSSLALLVLESSSERKRQYMLTKVTVLCRLFCNNVKQRHLLREMFSHSVNAKILPTAPLQKGNTQFETACIRCVNGISLITINPKRSSSFYTLKSKVVLSTYPIFPVSLFIHTGHTTIFRGPQSVSYVMVAKSMHCCTVCRISMALNVSCKLRQSIMINYR